LLTAESNFQQFILGSKERILGLYDNLIQVKSDFELQEAGFKLHYAIDFAALFLYSYPLMRLVDQVLVGYSTPTEDERVRALVRQNTAVLFGVSYSPGKNILLPPYERELHYFYRFIEKRNLNVIANKNLLDKIANIVIEIERDKEIQTILSLVIDGQVLTTNQKTRLQKILEDNYRYIWTLLTTQSQQRSGLTRMTDLLISKGLKPLRDAFPDITIAPIDVDIKEGEWQEKFEEDERNQRGAQEGRASLRTLQYAQKADARVCEYLKLLNEQLNPIGEAVVLVTPADTITRVLSPHKFVIGPNSQPIQPVRGLPYLLARMLCSNPPDFQAIDRDKLQKNLGTIERYNNLLISASRIFCSRVF